MKTKRNSQALHKAVARAEGLASISKTLDLGKGLSLKAFSTLLADARALQESYNENLAAADGFLADLVTKEAAVREMSARMLSGVASSFGTDSAEYAKAGGKRMSERRHSTSKKKST